MYNWIDALADLQSQGEPCVLVTIIEELGSTPRNAGSKMVISATQTFDTIGGGHLEYKAMQIGREMLASGKQDTHLERFSLGASLGQCCGGVTVLLFEPMGQVQAQIAVFGAGHVGRALVPLLASLPCRVRWIDSRDAEFPGQIPHGVRKIVAEEPVDEIDDLPAGSEAFDYEGRRFVVEKMDGHRIATVRIELVPAAPAPTSVSPAPVQRAG